MPPSSQYASGAPAAVARTPTSSLPAPAPGSRRFSGAQPRGERVERPGEGRGVVDDDGEPFGLHDGGLLRGPGGSGLTPHDAVDGGKDALPHVLVVAADVELQLRLAGDHVRGIAGVDGPHGEDGRRRARDLAGDDGLQAEHGRGRKDDRVDGGLGHGAVRAAADEPDAQRVGARVGRTRVCGDLSRGQGRHVLAEDHVRLREAVVETVVHHRLRASAELLRRLGTSSCAAMATSLVRSPHARWARPGRRRRSARCRCGTLWVGTLSAPARQASAGTGVNHQPEPSRQGSAGSLHQTGWARWGLNPRPTDYESAALTG